MAVTTNYAVRDTYSYLEGFNNYHSSEAFKGANPKVINSPQKPPYGLRTERISGSSFTAPREQNLQTWLYRSNSSLDHGDFTVAESASDHDAPKHWTPNGYMWPSLDLEKGHDWTSQRMLGRNGDPAKKEGLSIWLFHCTESMPERTAFSSLDGDSLIIIQSGTLDIQTELGKMMVRQNEIAVVPRGIRYRVQLPAGPARGYVCEVYQGHFQLPNLGAIGSTGLANIRDFQIPTAFYDGKVSASGRTLEPNNSANSDWTILSRLNSRLWACIQDHTPFDVAAWHGTYYPFKYDLARFCQMGNVCFDEHDPSLFVVLTVPSHREPGTAVLDFAVISPRWQVGDQTLWIPYYHRNTMSEFYGPIVYDADPESPLNKSDAGGFKPFACGLNGSMACHGAAEDEYAGAQAIDTSKPTKQMQDGISVFLLETELPLFLTDWAYEKAVKNFKAKSKEAAKM